MITVGLHLLPDDFHPGTVSFYTMRFLLGAAEAGFFPGIILYMKHWFPPGAARAVAWFMTGESSGRHDRQPDLRALLGLHGSGSLGMAMDVPDRRLARYSARRQWYSGPLSDTPRDAKWLTSRSETWLLRNAGRAAN